MSSENYEEPNEIEFRPSSKDIKFEDWEGDYKDNPTPEAKFAWLCKSCSNWNSDSTIIQPHAHFHADWYCKKCKKLTSVIFPDQDRHFWVTLHPHIGH